MGFAYLLVVAVIPRSSRDGLEVCHGEVETSGIEGVPELVGVAGLDLSHHDVLSRGGDAVDEVAAGCGDVTGCRCAAGWSRWRRKSRVSN